MAFMLDSPKLQNTACNTALGSPAKTRDEITIGSSLDARITGARQEVERLCVLKAKLEALNVLGHPASLYNEVYDFRND